jgi:hypothetical protein
MCLDFHLKYLASLVVVVFDGLSRMTFVIEAGRNGEEACFIPNTG